MARSGLDYAALTIAIIGAICWGLIGLFRFDFIRYVFGDMTVISRIFYTIVGACGIYLISTYFKNRQESEQTYTANARTGHDSAEHFTRDLG